MNTSSQDLSSWLLSRPPLEDLTALLRDVAGFFTASGVNVSHLIARLARVADPELAELAAGVPVALPIDAETEINECYRQLRALSASQDSVEYAGKLARLRALQEDEARRLAAMFRTNVGLDLTAFESTLERADELLALHEDPASHD